MLSPLLMQQHQQRRSFSDNLLGHSPMATPTPRPNASRGDKSKGDEEASRIPTAHEVAVAGGIWNPTSAKRDKIGELKAELKDGQETLDDVASPDQILDLYLADGVQWIVHTVDQTRLSTIVETPSVVDVDVDVSDNSVVKATTNTTTTTADTTSTNDTTSTTDDAKEGDDKKKKEDDKKKKKDEGILLDLPPALDPTQWKAEEPLLDVQAWLEQQQESIASTLPEGQLNKDQWETYLDETIAKLDEALATLPPERYLRDIRDLYQLPPKEARDGLVAQSLQSSLIDCPEQKALTAHGHKLLARYRLLLTKATCEQLKDSWDSITTLTDEALDRLATQITAAAVEEEGEAGEEGEGDNNDHDSSGTITSLSFHKLNQVVRASLMGNAVDRLDVWWDLADHNGDGLLEKTEMENVCFSAVKAVETATLVLFEEALEASPARGGTPATAPAEPVEPTDDAAPAEPADGAKEEKEKTKQTSTPSRKPGWRERRREAKAKKQLLKSFRKATKKHFPDEIELPHRLRCIYSWAEKSHQDNNLASVLIEASGWSGRKRYVELNPKISLAEFREAQQIHCTHLERVGWEVTRSFREDLWVEQGQGRQNNELARECGIFLLIVAVIDYGIIVL